LRLRSLYRPSDVLIRWATNLTVAMVLLVTAARTVCAGREPAPEGEGSPVPTAPGAKAFSENRAGTNHPIKVVIKRRHSLTEEELRKQLLKVPEVNLDLDQERSASTRLLNLAAKSETSQHQHRVALLRDQRPDLARLPMRMGPERRLGKQAATDLEN